MATGALPELRVVERSTSGALSKAEVCRWWWWDQHPQRHIDVGQGGGVTGSQDCRDLYGRQALQFASCIVNHKSERGGVPKHTKI